MPPSSAQPASSLMPSQEGLSQQEVHGSELSETIEHFQKKTADTQLSKSPETLIEPGYEYPTLATEHSKLISQGKTSLEIATWLAEKLHFIWGDHHGEFQTCSTPQGDITHLKKFLSTLGVSWSQANGGSNNHPEFFLGDPYLFNALFGKKNMQKSDQRNAQIDRDWKAMGDDFVAKEKYLKKAGLDIKGDWSKLTGLREDNGGFKCSDELQVSGSLNAHYVHSMWLDRGDSNVYPGNASQARLCFLA